MCYRDYYNQKSEALGWGGGVEESQGTKIAQYLHYCYLSTYKQ